MKSVEQEHRQEVTVTHCPICGQPELKTYQHTNAMNVVTANSECANAHGWEIRWVNTPWPATA